MARGVTTEWEDL
jgi:hypothetical protein